MGLVISGEVSGRMLAVAMLRAHAATQGGLKEKQAAGVGQFRQYLRENSARQEAWDKLSHLPPEVALARASLSSIDLSKAERLLEETTDPNQRKALLERVIVLPEEAGKARAISISELESKLQLPGQELVMIEHPDGEGKLIGRDQVTNAQYGIFIDQTGHRVPYYFWDHADLGRQNPDAAVVGVNYGTDAVGFTGWLGRRVPTEAEFLSAKRQGILRADKPWEWTATNEDVWQVFRSLRYRARRNVSLLPENRTFSDLGFRVAE